MILTLESSNSSHIITYHYLENHNFIDLFILINIIWNININIYIDLYIEHLSTYCRQILVLNISVLFII